MSTQETFVDEEGSEEAIPYEIPVEAIERFIIRDANKNRQYKMLCPYTIFLVLVTLLVNLHHIDFMDSEIYSLQEVANNIADYENFSKITDEEAFWKWFSKMMFQLTKRYVKKNAPTSEFVDVPCVNISDEQLDWNPSSNVSMFPVGAIILRQLKVKPKNCKISGHYILDKATIDQLPRECYSKYRESELDDRPFGGPNNSRFISNQQRSVYSATMELSKELTYSALEYEYHEYFHITVPGNILQNWNDATTKQICDLVDNETNNGWFHQGTRMVAVDVIIYSTSLDMFIFKTFWIEIVSTGYWTTSSFTTTMRLFRLDRSTKEPFIFAIDVMTLLFLIYFSLDLIGLILHNKEIEESWWGAVGFWEMYSLGNIILSFIVNSSRFTLWTRGLSLEMPGGNFTSTVDQIRATNDLHEYSIVLESIYTWYAMALVVSFLRLFYFLQYNERLNVLTETMKYSLNPLFGMLLTTLVIVLAYATSGTLIFGQFNDKFRTVLRSAVLLFRAMPGGGTDAYDDLSKVHAVATPLYYFTFLIIAWLLILNMVLGIIAASFQTVQENASKQTDWSPATLSRDIAKYFFGTQKESGNITIFKSASEACAWKAVHSTQKVTSFMDRILGGNSYVDSRIEALHFLRSYKEKTKSNYVCFVDLEDVFPHFDSKTRVSVYLRAKNTITSAYEAKQLQERQQNNLLNRLITIQRSLNELLELRPQIRAIDDIRQTTDSIDFCTVKMNKTVDNVQKHVTVLDDITVKLPPVVETISNKVTTMTPMLEEQQRQINFMVRLHEDSVLRGSVGAATVGSTSSRRSNAGGLFGGRRPRTSTPTRASATALGAEQSTSIEMTRMGDSGRRGSSGGGLFRSTNRPPASSGGSSRLFSSAKQPMLPKTHDE